MSHQVIVPESVSSLLGSEAPEGPLVAPPQRGDDDSLSAESVDSLHGEDSLCQSVSERLTFVLTFLTMTMKINGCYVFCVCVCPARNPLTVQPVPIPSSPHRHLQRRQLESPSHTTNAHGRRLAIGSDGVA